MFLAAVWMHPWCLFLFSSRTYTMQGVVGMEGFEAPTNRPPASLLPPPASSLPPPSSPPWLQPSLQPSLWEAATLFIGGCNPVHPLTTPSLPSPSCIPLTTTP